ncbi:MAG TPA: hypothetical protein VLX61_05690 [Anaerolineales bacterium]|nr:hypothetical protein [Anaerolineales bacterium]
MTVPSLVLGFVIALLIGALFHLFLGGGLGRLLLYLILSLIGFAVGEWVGGWRNWVLFPIGTLNLGMATLGSLAFLFIGYWLSLVNISPDDRDDAV